MNMSRNFMYLKTKITGAIAPFIFLTKESLFKISNLNHIFFFTHLLNIIIFFVIYTIFQLSKIIVTSLLQFELLLLEQIILHYYQLPIMRTCNVGTLILMFILSLCFIFKINHN